MAYSQTPPSGSGIPPWAWTTVTGQDNSGFFGHGGTLGLGDFSTDADRANQNRFGLQNQAAGAAGDFAGVGQAGYDMGTGRVNQLYQMLMGQANGQGPSVVGEQLRQGLNQNLANQQSMAASANPGNQAMAARNAAMNMAQLGYGFSGQQAQARLAEQQQAQQALAQLALQARQQDLSAALGSRQNQISGLGGPPLGQGFGAQMVGAGIGGLAGYLGARSGGGSGG